MASRIEDYALIGNCETAALVSLDGSIDWLCFPRFDSPACFAALLGTPENGRWRVTATDSNARISRRYRPDTLILETRFETAGGSAVLVDFMPLRDESHDLVRLVVGESGSVDLTTEIVVRFDYGRTVPWVSKVEDDTTTVVAGPDRLVLRSPVTLKGEDHRTVASFRVSAGERIPFVLTHGASHLPLPAQREAERALQSTEDFWREFASRCPDVGEWTKTVKRSLITLKALTFRPTGGIVAAPTTSLPERIGSSRNWDYRYCWLRDAAMTLQAFMNLGYFEEATAWREWLVRAIAGAPEQMQIMYGVAGERNLLEWEVDWLEGYGGSRPVRIGNAAAEQFQLDVYGEVTNAMTYAAGRGMPPHPRAEALAEVIMPFLEDAWHRADEGIWEVRGGAQHFTHSKIMAWVAFDRAAVAAKGSGRAVDAQHYRQVADEIHAEVCQRGYDGELGSFVQAYGSKAIDASLLQIPLVGFLPANDPRMIGTVRVLEATLLHDGLVHRYLAEHVDDGLPPREGAFLVCTFWLADVLILQNRQADARVIYERLVGLCNDVGLLAEEYDPSAKRMLGNFPQAFSHIGLINTALNLAERSPPVGKRTKPEEAR